MNTTSTSARARPPSDSTSGRSKAGNRPSQKGPELDRLQVLQPLAERHSHRLPGLASRYWELFGTKDSRCGDQEPKGGNRHEGACKDAAELSQELLARIGAEQITALEIVEEVGGRHG